MDVFVYGTLRDKSILEAVIGHPVARVTPARIRGYEARLVLGHDFPMIRPAPQGQAEGLILHDLDPADVAALNNFEGTTYTLEPMAVTCLNGQEHTALVYVDTGIYEDGGPFDLDIWASQLRQGFVEKFMKGRGFGQPAD